MPEVRAAKPQPKASEAGRKPQSSILKSKTYSAKPSQVTRQWYVLDASSASLGRVASLAAKYLVGKHKPMYTPHIDVGDGIIIINAAKLKLTGRKLEQKTYYSHSGYPGNLRALTAGQIKDRDATRLVTLAVRGMIPKNRLQDQRLKRLKVYLDDNHGQEAQKPTELEVGSRKQGAGKNQSSIPNPKSQLPRSERE